MEIKLITEPTITIIILSGLFHAIGTELPSCQPLHFFFLSLQSVKINQNFVTASPISAFKSSEKGIVKSVSNKGINSVDIR